MHRAGIQYCAEVMLMIVPAVLLENLWPDIAITFRHGGEMRLMRLTHRILGYLCAGRYLSRQMQCFEE